MSDPPIAPWQIWWVDFDPQVGREQAGPRPAVVVGSALACELPNQLVLVVPCTTRDRRLPFQPAITLDKPSFAMCDQVKSISRQRLRRLDRTRLVSAERDGVKFALRQMIDIR